MLPPMGWWTFNCFFISNLFVWGRNRLLMTFMALWHIYKKIPLRTMRLTNMSEQQEQEQVKNMENRTGTERRCRRNAQFSFQGTIPHKWNHPYSSSQISQVVGSRICWGSRANQQKSTVKEGESRKALISKERKQMRHKKNTEQENTIFTFSQDNRMTTRKKLRKACIKKDAGPRKWRVSAAGNEKSFIKSGANGYLLVFVS